MKKIPLTDNSGRWFDMDSARALKADSYTDQQGNKVCRATGHPEVWETLYLTLKGTFILIRDDGGEFVPGSSGAVEMDPERAVEWLIANGHQAEVKKLDMEKEERRLEL
jgi:hypothetical protein